MDRAGVGSFMGYELPHQEDGGFQERFIADQVVGPRAVNEPLISLDPVTHFDFGGRSLAYLMIYDLGHCSA